MFSPRLYLPKPIWAVGCSPRQCKAISRCLLAADPAIAAGSLLADSWTWSPDAELKSQNIAYLLSKHFLIHVHASRCETMLCNQRFTERLRSSLRRFLRS